MLRAMLPKKNSVIVTWLLSYVMVLLVPVVIAAVTYILTVRIVEKEIVNSNRYLIKRVQQQMDGLLNDAGRLTQEIALDSRISKYFVTDGAQHFEPYELFQLVQNLKFHSLLNQNISEFFIYFKKPDLIVSPNGFMNSRSFYQNYYSKSKKTYRQWKELIAKENGGEFIQVTYEDDNQQNNRTIALTRSLPLFKQRDTSVNIVILLDESKFMVDVQNIGALSKGTMLILDKKNRVLATSQPQNEKLATDLGFTKKLVREEGVVHTRAAGQNVVISYTTSQVLEWKYIAMIPNAVFWQKADFVRKLTFLSLLVCILTGGMITYYALKRNYDPISNLIRLLEGFNGSNYSREGNEYSFIREAIAKVQADLEARDTILARQNKALREHLLTRLITGKEGIKIPVEESLILNDITFKSNYFAVLAFYIEDFAEIAGLEDEAGEASLLKDYHNVQALIVKVVEELSGPQNTIYTVKMNHMLIGLANFDETEVEAGGEKLLQLAGEVRKMLEASVGVHLMIAVSSVHKTLAGLPEAYSEALQGLEYQRILGVKEITFYENIRELPKGNYYYPLEKEQQLLNAIKAGEFIQAKTVVEEIFKANFDQNVLPPKIIKCLLLDLVSTMIKTVNEINEIEQADFFAQLNSIDKLWECEHLPEMKRMIIEMLEKFCLYAENKSKTRTKNTDLLLMEKIKDYATQNYNNPNLAITTIADDFNLHPVYVSRLFKEVYGEGLLDYINKIRIQQAKQLFKDSQYGLEEVAKEVGYCSTRTFTRAFKKYEGITPGKYKTLE